MNNNIISMVLNKVVELQGNLSRIQDCAHRDIFKGASVDGFSLLLIGNNDAYLVSTENMDKLSDFLFNLKGLGQRFVDALHLGRGVRYIKVFAN